MLARKDELIAEERRLAQTVADHKSVIRQRRRQLALDAARLEEIRRRCRAFGFGFEHRTITRGEGDDIHGRRDPATT